MAPGGHGCPGPFRAALDEWDGGSGVAVRPWEHEQAELIDTLCRRYSQPPSVLLAEDVGILRRLAVLEYGERSKD